MCHAISLVEKKPLNINSCDASIYLKKTKSILHLSNEISTYSFRGPLQISCPVGEVSCHVQYLAVAGGWDERVVEHQRHQR